MKILLVVNSSASSVTARSRVIIGKALQADHDVTVAETNRRGHASRLAKGAVAAGTDVVAVLGGDGTLNEAANGLAGSPCALAVLPGGSTNVFARTLGIPNDPIDATATLLEALAADAIEPFGLGSVNGRYFLFHAGIGFDAEVVRQVERRSALKRYAGHPLFLYAAVTTWLRHYDRRRTHFSLHLPGGGVVDGSRFTLVLNTDPYTYLGNRPLRVAPDAAPDRGLVTFTMRSLGLATLGTVASSVLSTGEVARRHRNVDYRTDLSWLRVVGHTPFPFQIDGDFAGEAEELVLRYEPDMIRLVRPLTAPPPAPGSAPERS